LLIDANKKKWHLFPFHKSWHIPFPLASSSFVHHIHHLTRVHSFSTQPIMVCSWISVLGRYLITPIPVFTIHYHFCLLWRILFCSDQPCHIFNGCN
jgi:hypothetical protein